MQRSMRSEVAKRWQWRLVFLAPEQEEGQINEECWLVRQLGSQQMEQLRGLVQAVLADVRLQVLDLTDGVLPGAKGWQSVEERLLNRVTWAHLAEHHSEYMGAAIGDVLRSEALDPNALQCLDDEDQCHLIQALVDMAMVALEIGANISLLLTGCLTDWLQDWTESDSTDLASLVALAQEMCSPRLPRADLGSVNWAEVGF
ncbi:hypothetical protein [Candidatus Laterigemmans baculatus]|uniref:hypothetical protein n=1 Tax=Candidatus Laterigemmans baculatus TaxID=2770505 RepID=UPI0013DA70BB|nr:hypothetical protein [Candidatus Laterigemmans baculatus]